MSRQTHRQGWQGSCFGATNAEAMSRIRRLRRRCRKAILSGTPDPADGIPARAPTPFDLAHADAPRDGSPPQASRDRVSVTVDFSSATR